MKTTESAIKEKANRSKAQSFQQLFFENRNLKAQMFELQGHAQAVADQAMFLVHFLKKLESGESFADSEVGTNADGKLLIKLREKCQLPNRASQDQKPQDQSPTSQQEPDISAKDS